MTAKTTVMFADLTGSTGVFEALGNAKATQAITALTDWIAQVVTDYDGRVVKMLGDGVLALFPDGGSAVQAVVQMQREHARRQTARGPVQKLQLQVGLDSGDIVEQDGDCYGDAVNVASRLSDLSGARQIWASADVVGQLQAPPPGARFHPLGPVPIRGKAQATNVYRIDWQEDASTDMMTLPAFDPGKRSPFKPVVQGKLQLRYLDQAVEYTTGQLPIHLGRVREAEFVVADPRVSRLHARIDWRNDSFVLVDLSSYGTCVRFQGAPTELKLRRDDCVLHDSGEIALGPEFGDFSIPTVLFELSLGKK
ncbi:FHA domain-containing protein [Ramlibacter sp. XY19]|uniref:adenylate/guanylate cyclase domain-containing protein n=1 Tax=Ramlibacter paludis TaxID=2908000 RepID=UPI0023DB20BD|nr:adenylate/guanylate cyclase domain-containing protein [Ramlibacter paludis]MCG2591192.1 FHA domain-containing protein [Ramlibacter paludis]